MAWFSRTTYSSSDRSPGETDLNSWGLDLRTWGGNVDAAGNQLANLSVLLVGQISPTGSVVTLLGGMTNNGYFAEQSANVTLVNGANQNVNIGMSGHIVILGPTANFSIGGFTGGVDGRELTIVNGFSSFGNMTINHNDSGSSAANRIWFPSGSTPPAYTGMCDRKFKYYGSAGLWMPLSVAQ